MPKVHLSTEDADNMDIYVLVSKLDKNDEALLNPNISLKTILLFYFGPFGVLKASYRHINENQIMHSSYPSTRSRGAPDRFVDYGSSV
ncbi:hypothetical protein N7507_010017 [Penicillium longicatenatum]|nr:hypothetical protein N7507_010017 [Penicillium longicatenatum]